MAVDPVANLYVQLGMNVARLQGDVQKATTILDGFQRKVDRGFSTLLKGAGWTAAFAGITGFLHKAVQEASAAEQAITQLNTSLATLGTQRVGDINLVSAAIQRMAKQIQQATGFADEEIMRGASRMLTAGIGTQDLQLATETATNLARAYGMELEPAMQMVVQAYWGQQRAIKKVVPEMQELLKEGMRGTDVLKQLNDTLGPQAQAQAETFAGQLRLLKVESAEFAESVGMKLIPALTKFFAILNAIRKGEGLKGYEAFNALGDVYVSPEQAAASIAGMTPSQIEKMTGGASWNHPLMYGKPGVKPKFDGAKKSAVDELDKEWKKYLAEQQAEQKRIEDAVEYANRVAEQGAERFIAIEKNKNDVIKARAELIADEADRHMAVFDVEQKNIDLIRSQISAYTDPEKRKAIEAELALRQATLDVNRTMVGVQEQLRKDPLAGAHNALANLQRDYLSYGKLMEDYTVGVFRTMEYAFAEFCDTGQFRFKDFVRSALINLNTLLFKIAVLEPMAARLKAAIESTGGGGMGGFLSGLFGGGGGGGDLFGLFGGSSGMFFDRGAAFNAGHVVKMAKGSIVHSPTVFPMASGMGLMGEAGPEAVVPLKRTASGDLGIQGGAGGSVININISAADAQSFYDMCRRNPSAITDPIERALQGNQSIRRTIMRTAK